MLVFIHLTRNDSNLSWFRWLVLYWNGNILVAEPCTSQTNRRTGRHALRLR